MFTVPSETSPALASAAAREPLRRVLGEPAPTAAVLVDTDRLALQLLTEFRAAWSRGDESRISEVMVEAIVFDDAHRGGPRLMDEIRGIASPADDEAVVANFDGYGSFWGVSTVEDTEREIAEARAAGVAVGEWVTVDRDGQPMRVVRIPDASFVDTVSVYSPPEAA